MRAAGRHSACIGFPDRIGSCRRHFCRGDVAIAARRKHVDRRASVGLCADGFIVEHIYRTAGRDRHGYRTSDGIEQTGPVIGRCCPDAPRWRCVPACAKPEHRDAAVADNVEPPTGSAEDTNAIYQCVRSADHGRRCDVAARTRCEHRNGRGIGCRYVDAAVAGDREEIAISGGNRTWASRVSWRSDRARQGRKEDAQENRQWQAASLGSHLRPNLEAKPSGDRPARERGHAPRFGRHRRRYSQPSENHSRSALVQAARQR